MPLEAAAVAAAAAARRLPWAKSSMLSFMGVGGGGGEQPAQRVVGHLVSGGWGRVKEAGRLPPLPLEVEECVCWSSLVISQPQPQTHPPSLTANRPATHGHISTRPGTTRRDAAPIDTRFSSSLLPPPPSFFWHDAAASSLLLLHLNPPQPHALPPPPPPPPPPSPPPPKTTHPTQGRMYLWGRGGYGRYVHVHAFLSPPPQTHPPTHPSSSFSLLPFPSSPNPPTPPTHPPTYSSVADVSPSSFSLLPFLDGREGLPSLYVPACWEDLYERLQQARHPKYYNEVG